nr:heparan-alpha-glucosaminide N-acetyltransferase domain-containing protein [Olsenella uli]
MAANGRIGAFDAVRGLSVISMVLFHLCYDLRFIYRLDLGWFAPPLQDVWRASISWTFVFVAGCMFALSRDNLRRGLQYAGVALAIFVATSLAAVDTPISFGIIYCMAACTLAAWALSRAGLRPRGPLAAAVLLVAFLALLDLPRGTVGLGPASAAVPEWLYATGWLSWLGLPGPSFASGDYYPLLPYLMLYLSGVALGSLWAERGYPAWARGLRVAPLNFVGRHALVVYVAHQPVLLALCAALELALG